MSIPTGDAGLGALAACKILKVKPILDYRDEWEDYAISLVTHSTERWFYHVVKRVATDLYTNNRYTIAVTPNFAEALGRRGLQDIKLIPNGADIKIFKPRKDEKTIKPFKIVHSGSIGSYYWLNGALESIKILASGNLKNITLQIVGRGEMQGLFNLATQLGILSKIEYKGVITNKLCLAKYIAEADVGLILYNDNPLWKNSLPAKFFEYCACGIPVIATAYPDSLIAKFIRKYEIGITSRPMDERELARAIYQLYNNKLFRKMAGKKARKLIEDKFDRKKNAEEYLNLLISD